MIRRHGVTLISIGNGTASYETEQFVSQLIENYNLSCRYVITNEAGASVYSASELAREELPDLDVTIRGAVSIARRIQDPLAESVKIDPSSIGVGQYQHDVNQKDLTTALDQTVTSVVNYVGVDLNTASAALLQHIAGLTASTAGNIVTYRNEKGPFKNRQELLNVPRLGPATFTQCAGFLRIKDGEEPLDNTSVHPESYDLAAQIAGQYGLTRDDLKEPENWPACGIRFSATPPRSWRPPSSPASRPSRISSKNSVSPAATSAANSRNPLPDSTSCPFRISKLELSSAARSRTSSISAPSSTSASRRRAWSTVHSSAAILSVIPRTSSTPATSSMPKSSVSMPTAAASDCR